MKRFARNRFALAALSLTLPFCALADLSGTITLASNTRVNLDSGATGTGAGGDALWSGSILTPQGVAKAFILQGVSSLTGVSKAFLDTIKSFATNAAIPSTSLPVGTVIAVYTNGGNAAAVLVTANSNGSITLQFTTFGATGGGGGGPSITNVLNNSSDIPAGFPNSGIAPGSLFKVLGSGLAAGGDATLHDSQATGGLPTTLNGATITVTAGGQTKTPAMYYATPTQLVGVMPSSTPPGPATVTVNYNGLTSNSFQIQIVAAAPGITTYNGSGVAQHALLGTLVTYTDSAKPGEVLIIWGTGYGATANSDTRYDTSGNQTSLPYNIYIGGVQANVAYKGASVYPGVGVFGVTIPANVPTGCYVAVAAVANGTVVSNIVTLPIATNGGACTDPQFGINGNQIPAAGQPLKSGFLVVTQQTSAGAGVSNSAVAFFQQTAGVTSPGGGAITSIGGCVLTQITTGGSAGTTTGLNAGTITVTGPGGSPLTLSGLPQSPGIYFASLPSIPATGGAYVFNGTAGSQVGAFTATVNFPNPLLAWTNQGVASNVTRSQALTVTWTGGAPGSYVIISGSSSGTSGGVTGSYSCFAPQSALTFTVPSYVLLGLPAGTGTTSVQNSTTLTPFSATGIDSGSAFGNVSFSANSNYN